MLIYNSQKEFIGIDIEDLQAFGFESLADLQMEATDFSDMFLRTPGYIHNFQYVHWIDYISFGGSLDTPKAIVHTQKADYSCTLSISKFFVSDSPASNAYAIHLNDIKRLTPQESSKIAEDISKKAIPDALDKSMIPEPLNIDVEKVQSSIAKQNALFTGESFSSENQDEDTTLNEELLNLPDDEPVIQETKEKTTIDETPITLPEVVDLEVAEEKIDIIQEKEPEVQEEIVATEEETPDSSDTYENNYIYNPQVASDELGLPVDLIEEFIEDFIAQAKEFKDELYKSIDEEDINNLRILSHKLKGVAANLRIEDALEVLVIINTSDDLKLVRKNLNYFYIIIQRLDNDEQVENVVAEKPLLKKDEDDFVLDFKDDNEIKKSNHSTYNREEVANAIGLDIDTFNELFNDYIIDAEELLNAMQKLIESDDLIHLKKHIVKLEGMNKNMRIDSFSKELQSLLDTPNQEVAREALAKINTQISSMKD